MSAIEMFDNISSVFQWHTLVYNFELDEISIRPKLQWVKKKLSYINRIQKLRSILKSTYVKIGRRNLAGTIPEELPFQFERLITTMDALDKISEFFNLKVVDVDYYRKNYAEDCKKVTLRKQR